MNTQMIPEQPTLFLKNVPLKKIVYIVYSRSLWMPQCEGLLKHLFSLQPKNHGGLREFSPLVGSLPWRIIPVTARRPQDTSHWNTPLKLRPCGRQFHNPTKRGSYVTLSSNGTLLQVVCWSGFWMPLTGYLEHWWLTMGYEPSTSY